MITMFYTKFNTFEILDGGDGMIMVDGNIVKNMAHAKLVCLATENRKLETERNNQNEIWYCAI